MPKYDYLIVGSGLFGATFAYFAHKHGMKCLVIDKRPQLGGNVYCENIEGINVHKYGAHIFHTSNKKVWDFVNSIVPFNRYTNSPVADFHGKRYNLPFNMNTFYEMWGVKTPAEAQAIISAQTREAIEEQIRSGKRLPTGEATERLNLEDQALSLVGKDIFYTLIKEYTEKQWGRKCTELPAFIIKRLPVRLMYDNNYFNDSYQGIPIGGYNKLISGLLLTSPRRGGTTPLLRGGDGEGPDCLVGIDVPLNKPKYSLDHSNGGYRKMADPMNYSLLQEKAKEMRKNPTEAENAFWQLVKGDNAFGVKFRRQHVIDNYIVDFVSLEGKLVVEIDGGYHFTQEQQIEDNLRSQVLKDYGFTILRLKNEEVIADPEEVIAKVKMALWLAQKAPLREAFSPSYGEGQGVGSTLPTGEGRGEARRIADCLVYTGRLDEFFDFCYGKLNWRTVSFKTRIENTPNYQGNAVVNYTSHDVPYTRVIEHKHFEMFGQHVYDIPKTVISEEYSTEYKEGMEPYYPVNDERNNALAEKYRSLSQTLSRREGFTAHDKSPYGGDLEGLTSLPTGEGKGGAVIFGGRLAEYKYYDMAPIIEKVMNLFSTN